MKKYLLLLFALIFSSASVFAETNELEGNEALKGFIERSHSGKVAKPQLRSEYFYLQRAYPYSKINEDSRINAIRQTNEMFFNKAGKALTQAQQPQWRCIGPYGIGGRIKTVAHHPSVEGTVYVGAAAGGIWKTTDRGENWIPIFDYENGIAFGSIAIDFKNPDIIYAATGEMSTNVDAYLGAGVFKSTDAGSTWKNIGLTNVGAFSKIYVHPKNSNIIVAAATKRNMGFYKSTDAGSTWIKSPNFNKTVSDVSYNPNDENEYFIGVSGEGIYRTTDLGETWTSLNAGLPDGMGRVSVQFAHSNLNTLYSLIEVSPNGIIYKTTDRGLTWRPSYNGGVTFFGYNTTQQQGWYNNFIEVHPENENIVIAGGINLYRTDNGGSSWENVSINGDVHVDQHHAAFAPMNPNIVYVGNDGGMYRSVDAGRTWTMINNNLHVTQFYGMAIDHTKENRTYGGTQDNGTLGFLNTSDWSAIAGGDGFRVVVDKENTNIIYGEYYNGNLWKYNMSTGARSSIIKGIPTDDAAAWDAPLIMDPTLSFVLYHGRHALYASYDYGDNWFPITGQMEMPFSAIATSPLSELVIYAGTQDGKLLVSLDGGEKGADSFEEVSKNGLVNRWITDICCSNVDKSTAYVTFSGYGTQHIYKTTNYGVSWRSISTGLPDVPCNALTIHPEHPNWLFAATDVGVFASYDDGENWLPYGNGLPRSPVVDIDFRMNLFGLDELMLRIATHGRSMWEVEVPNDVITDADITSPTGGELLIGGSYYMISWYGFDLPVKLEFSPDNGAHWQTITESCNGNKWNMAVPSTITTNARIRVTSVNKSELFRVSNIFSISPMDKGSVLKTGGVNYIPYGLAYDGKGGLWTTSFQSNNLYKLNADNFAVEKMYTIPGDSLFTDLTIDRDKNIIYIHKMNSTTSGSGGLIMVFDMEGNFQRSFKTPAYGYAIGLEFVDGMLIVGDRDGSQYLTVVNPETGAKISETKNPYRETYGPRGLCYDGTQYLYQASTKFPGGGALTEALIIKIDKNNLGKEVARMPAEDRNGMINLRGIEYDPRDNSFWVSSYGGGLYKLAGFETIVSKEDEKNPILTETNLEAKIFPNPACNFTAISFKAGSDYSNIRINIVNVLGENIGTLFDKNVNRDEYSYVQLNTEQYPSGIYTIVFYENGRKVLSRQLAIIK